MGNPYVYYEGRKQYYVQRLVSCDKYGLYCSGKRYSPTFLFLTAEDYMPAISLGEGAELLAAAKITDDHGQSFWYLLEAARNDDGTLRSVPAPMLKTACPNWQPGGYVSLRWPGA